MRKILFLLIFSLLVFSCQKKITASFNEVQLKKPILELINIYLEDNNKLYPSKHVLIVQQHEFKNDTVIIVNHTLLNYWGYNDDLNNTLLTDFNGFRVHVVDEQNMISIQNGNKIKVNYEHLSKDIVPSTYGGNMWEVHFKNKKVEKIFFYNSRDTIKLNHEIGNIEFFK